MTSIAQRTTKSLPNIHQVLVPLKDNKGKGHVIALRVRRDGTVTEVESQSDSGGYEWTGYTDHHCEYRDVYPTRECRHIQAVRKYEQDRQSQW
jgi:hypothetical protein